MHGGFRAALPNAPVSHPSMNCAPVHAGVGRLVDPPPFLGITARFRAAFRLPALNHPTVDKSALRATVRGDLSRGSG